MMRIDRLHSYEKATSPTASSAVGVREPELQSRQSLITKSSVRVTLSEEAKLVLNSEPPVTQLPDLVVKALAFDSAAWKSNLPSLKPWTSDTERQYQQYVSAQMGLANQALNPALSSVSMSGSVSYATFQEVLGQIALVAYRALSDKSAFVDGPGSADMIAGDFITMLENTDIVITGGPYSVSGEFSIGADGRGRVEIFPDEFADRYPGKDFDVTLTSVLFHELGHASNAGRADASATWDGFYQSTRGAHPGWSDAQIESAYASSEARTNLEARTSTRGWGLAEIAGLPFDTNIDRAGVAPR